MSQREVPILPRGFNFFQVGGMSQPDVPLSSSVATAPAKPTMVVEVPEVHEQSDHSDVTMESSAAPNAQQPASQLISEVATESSAAPQVQQAASQLIPAVTMESTAVSNVQQPASQLISGVTTPKVQQPASQLIDVEPSPERDNRPLIPRNIHPYAGLPMLPEGYVPASRDVVTGRGKRNWTLEGNVYFRKCVRDHVKLYLMAPTKACKSQVVRKIVDHMYDVGGLFLMEDACGKYFAMGEDQVKEKVGHSLRDHVTSMKMRQEKQAADEAVGLVRKEAKKARLEHNQRTAPLQPAPRTFAQNFGSAAQSHPQHQGGGVDQKNAHSQMMNEQRQGFVFHPQQGVTHNFRPVPQAHPPQGGGVDQTNPHVPMVNEQDQRFAGFRAQQTAPHNFRPAAQAQPQLQGMNPSQGNEAGQSFGSSGNLAQNFRPVAQSHPQTQGVVVLDQKNHGIDVARLQMPNEQDQRSFRTQSTMAQNFRQAVQPQSQHQVGPSVQMGGVPAPNTNVNQMYSGPGYQDSTNASPDGVSVITIPDETLSSHHDLPPVQPELPQLLQEQGIQDRQVPKNRAYRLTLDDQPVNVVGVGSCDWHDGEKAIVLIIREGKAPVALGHVNVQPDPSVAGGLNVRPVAASGQSADLVI
jgi:hypothetical protein